jgi:hypothetical protein
VTRAGQGEIGPPSTSGLAIETMFKRDRIDVLSQTKNRQEPWESSSLTGEFHFFTGSGATAARPELNESRRAEVGSLLIRAPIGDLDIFLGQQHQGRVQRRGWLWPAD